ncbi:hypothetical protein [Streptomyces sp. NPDC059209]|uniref:hypothetical protein n=1 Tax=Streptomyces sp. NPDC059209 TaxID=3346769 RepID=UPI0036BBB928
MERQSQLLQDLVEELRRLGLFARRRAASMAGDGLLIRLMCPSTTAGSVAVATVLGLCLAACGTGTAYASDADIPEWLGADGTSIVVSDEDAETTVRPFYCTDTPDWATRPWYLPAGFPARGSRAGTPCPLRTA